MSSQPTSDSNDGAEHIDLGKFAKASFAAYLHHALTLVNAIPKRESPTMDDIRKDLEVCLTVIVAAMNNEQNKSHIQNITDALETYCKGHPETNQRQAFVEAANAALIFLQPLSIGNSRDAVNPDSDDFVWFMRQDRAINSEKSKSDNRMPDICCATKKNIIEGQSRDQHQPAVEVEQLLKDLASQPEPDRLLEWKQYDSCWESIRTIERLDITRPLVYNEGYTGAPLKEYGHTENYPSPIVHGLSDSEDSESEDPESELNLHDIKTSLIPADEPDILVHPINAKWCVENAKQVFYDTFGRDHVMNVAINDELLRVWYFDHESTIQTSAFNFIQDLPYFLLFLFALQRFSRSDWGYIDQLSPVNAKVIEPVDLSKDSRGNEGTPSPFTFTRLPNHFQAHHHLDLSGRATHVIYGHTGNGGIDQSVVLKLYWRKKVHFPEGAFLREATERLQGQLYSDVCDYLPTLLVDKDFPQFSTDIIRRRLMLPISNEATYQPYFIVLPRYEPLTVRTKNWMFFFHDYMALIYCHFMLWSVGIEHRDISVGNLMWNPQTQKPKLCDFDLSHFSGHEQIGFKNTGTLMFMAFDLLSESAMNGEVERLYRHDLESFAAVFVWIMFRYDAGVIKDKDALIQWKSPSFTTCRSTREETFRNLAAKEPLSHIPPAIWFSVVDAARELKKISAQSEDFEADVVFHKNMESYPDLARKPLSLEDGQKLNHWSSINVLTDILPILTHDLIDSEDEKEMKKRIEQRLVELKNSKETLDNERIPKPDPLSCEVRTCTDM